MKGQSPESFDPPHMVKGAIIDKVLRVETRKIVGEAITEITDHLVHFSKALMVFNSILMPRVIKSTVEGLTNSILAEDIYDNLLNSVMDNEIALLSGQDVEVEAERLESAEKEKGFAEYIDSLIMETCLTKLSREYELEEAAILKREAAAKQKRDMVAEKRRELKRETQENSAGLAKPKDVTVKLKNQNMGAAATENKSIVGLLAAGELKKVGPRSVAMSVKAGSQMSLQDAVKEKMAAMEREEGGKLGPKNQLENVLMNLHS